MGSFECSCNSNFVLGLDRKSCEGKFVSFEYSCVLHLDKMLFVHQSSCLLSSCLSSCLSIFLLSCLFSCLIFLSSCLSSFLSLFCPAVCLSNRTQFLCNSRKTYVICLQHGVDPCLFSCLAARFLPSIMNSNQGKYKFHHD